MNRCSNVLKLLSSAHLSESSCYFQMSSEVATNGQTNGHDTNGLSKTHQNGDTNGTSKSHGEHEEMQYLDLIRKIIETGVGV